jgi:hypothetical protein
MKNLSIVGMAYGKELFKQMEDVSWAHIRKGGVSITARRCRNNNGFTGGVVVKAEADKLGHESKTRTAMRRLSPGWTEQQFRNAVSRCYHEVANSSSLRGQREALYNATWPLVSSLTNRRIQDIEAQGREVVYENMSQADVDFWFAYYSR